MVNRPKQIGTAAESAVVSVAREHGFAAADRHVLTGGADQGDVWLLPTGMSRQVVIEVKAGHTAERASMGLIEEWVGEAQREADAAARGTTVAVGFLVAKRAGVGAGNAHRWWAYMTLDTLDRMRSVEVWGTFAKEFAHDQIVRLEYGDVLELLRGEAWGR